MGVNVGGGVKIRVKGGVKGGGGSRLGLRLGSRSREGKGQGSRESVMVGCLGGRVRGAVGFSWGRFEMKRKCS